jgi:hypothetical protein
VDSIERWALDSTQSSAIKSSVESHTGSRLFTVNSWEIDNWWPHVAHHVARWVDHDGTWSADEIRFELKAGRAQLWCFHRGSILGIWVTRIEATDRCLWGVVWGCAGDFSEHKEDAVAFFGIIEDWFREKGCEFVEWVGRDGWARIFPDYKRHAVILRKRL